MALVEPAIELPSPVIPPVLGPASQNNQPQGKTPKQQAYCKLKYKKGIGMYFK